MSPGELMGAVLRGLYGFVTHPDVGGIASVGGLLASLYVLWTIKELKTKLVVSARFPQLMTLLQESASQIARSLADFASQRPVLDVELAKCKSNLKSLEAKAKGPVKEAIKQLISLIAQYQTVVDQQTEANVRRIYAELNGVVQDLTNMAEDYKME